MVENTGDTRDTSDTRDTRAARRRNGVQKLLADYVDVCNRAIAENEHRFVFRQAKKLNRQLWGEASFHTLVYEDDPRNVIEEATLHYDPRRLELSVEDSADGDVAFSWKLPIDYMEDVVQRPDWYVEHPAALDWNWLTERVRDESTALVTDRRAIAAGVAGIVAGVLLGMTVAALRQRSGRQTVVVLSGNGDTT